MNFLDIIILIPLIWLGWIGFKKGFIIEVFTLLALFVGLYAGIHFSEYASNGIKNTFSSESKFVPAFAFTITFLAVGAMVYFAGKALERVIKLAMLSPLNKLGGVLFALLKGSYFVSIILMLLSSYDSNNKFIPLETKDNSLLYRPLLKFSSSTIPGLAESNFFKNQSENEDQLSAEKVLRAKELADSLHIETNDLVELKNIYDKYEKRN